jgi:molybdopterin molybdotransferase
VFGTVVDGRASRVRRTGRDPARTAGGAEALPACQNASMIAWEEAAARVVADLQPLAPEPVPLAEALGRALAEDVIAPRDLPPFANSAMDGWALRAADAARGRLPIAGVRFAGAAPGEPLPPGSAVRIFTGAPLPPGADCVVKQEDALQDGGVVVISSGPAAGDFVRPAGEDARAGEVALPAGLPIGPAEIGHAAALGRTHLLVHRRPRIALLATGDELGAVSEPPREGVIFESNSHALAAAARLAGGIPVPLGIARDRPGEIEALVAAAAGRFDALLTTGGASVGERDLVKDSLRDLGAEERFWRVAMKPGKPFGLFRLGGVPVFLCPGNPASASVTFEVFVRPALRRLAGLPGHGRVELRVPLAAPARKPAELAVFVRGNLVDGAFVASPFQSSGLTRSLVGQGALAILPAGPGELAAGDAVTCRLLGP